MKQISWLATSLIVAIVLSGCANLELADSVEALSKRVTKLEQLQAKKPADKKDTGGRPTPTQAAFFVTVTQCHENGSVTVNLVKPEESRKAHPGLTKVNGAKMVDGHLVLLTGDKQVAKSSDKVDCKAGLELGMVMVE